MTRSKDVLPGLWVPLFASLALAGCAGSLKQSPEVSDGKWFKGNTHTHTVLSGHGDASPEYVARWYHDRGYNFLILSEHNQFIDPQNVELPVNKRDDFILIPGEEITGAKVIHATAMNSRSVAPPVLSHEDNASVVQDLVDSTRHVSGEPILNHPNYRFALDEHDILPVRNLHMFELFNGHNEVFNYGDAEHQSTEELWDKLLTTGMRIYGVSSDDAHIFQRIGSDTSNPGRGWVVVKAPILTPDTITEAMKSGQFYASNGVHLEKYEQKNGQYSIVVDKRETAKELTSLVLRGRSVRSGTAGYKVEFIGPGGVVLSSVDSSEATYPVDGTEAYVRAKVTYTRQLPDGQFEEYYAWGQPIFTDHRKTKK